MLHTWRAPPQHAVVWQLLRAALQAWQSHAPPSPLQPPCALAPPSAALSQAATHHSGSECPTPCKSVSEGVAKRTIFCCT